MKTKVVACSTLAILAVLFAVGAQAEEREEKRVWVSKDHHAIHVGGEANAMFFGDDATTLNVSDLRDGERRTVGLGAKQVTVSRDGDMATIVREANGDDARLEIECNTTSDTCQIVTFDDDPEKVMVVVEKTRECINGAGDCAHAAIGIDSLGDLGEGAHVVIKKVKCDGAGNCEELEDVRGGMTVDIDVMADGKHEPHAVFLKRDAGVFGDPNKVVLGCPEGDSRIHVAKEEAQDVFLCPKHSVPMERQARPRVIRQIKIDDGD